MTAAGRQARVHALPFFLLTFAWTWLMWGIAVAAGLSATEGPGSLLYLLGVLGPLAGAVWAVLRGGRGYRAEFLRRIWDPRRVPTVWWLAMVAVAAGPAGLGATAAQAAGVRADAVGYGVGTVGAVVVVALVAGFAEEPGWRGAALDASQSRTHPLRAAAGIGLLWSLWHLPLHFIEGSWYHGMGLGSVRFWLVHLLLVQLGILYAWLTNGAKGSILIAILAHAGFNIAAGLVPSTTTRDVIAFVAVTIMTVAVIASTRGRLAFDGPLPHSERT
jgi:uncharacterized protein